MFLLSLLSQKIISKFLLILELPTFSEDFTLKEKSQIQLQTCFFFKMERLYLDYKDYIWKVILKSLKKQKQSGKCQQGSKRKEAFLKYPWTRKQYSKDTLRTDMTFQNVCVTDRFGVPAGLVKKFLDPECQLFINIEFVL